jgi:large subunit ribosomal protein L4
MELAVKMLDGGEAGAIDLPDEVFGLEPRADILHRVVRWQLAKRRAGTHKAKNRSEINATGRKLYTQTGTGRARHSDKKAPQFRGGGKAHGPVLRSHAHDLPKKVRVLGLKHALSAKARDGELIVLDAATAAEPKTRALTAQLKALGLTNALVIDGAELDVNFSRAARNIPQIDVLPLAGLNVYDILRRHTLVLTRAAVAGIEARFANGGDGDGRAAPDETADPAVAAGDEAVMTAVGGETAPAAEAARATDATGEETA